MADIIGEIMDIQDEIVKWRRDLHQIPEVGLEVPMTVAYVYSRLVWTGLI